MARRRARSAGGGRADAVIAAHCSAQLLSALPEARDDRCHYEHLASRVLFAELITGAGDYYGLPGHSRFSSEAMPHGDHARIQSAHARYQSRSRVALRPMGDWLAASLFTSLFLRRFFTWLLLVTDAHELLCQSGATSY